MKRLNILMMLLLSLCAQAQMTKDDCPRDTVDGRIVYHYKVEKSIGLWRISQNFGVSQEEIISANPQLQERGLHVDEILQIPGEKVQAKFQRKDDKKIGMLPATVLPKPAAVADTVAVQVEDTVAAVAADTVVAVVEDTVVAVVEDTVLTSVPMDSSAIRLAMLLPLNATAVKRDQSMDRFMDFYEGALLAVNDIQRMGQHVVLYVYDVEKTDSRINQLIEDSLLNNMTAIIGPAYPLQVAHLAPYVREHKIPTLVPFTDQVTGIESNPYLMQFNATDMRKGKAVADYLQSRGDSINCVLVDAKEADIPQSIRCLRSEIIARGIPYTRTSIHAVLADSIGLALRDSVENILIFNTEKYGNLQVLMPRVLQAKSGRALTLYSQFSWQKERILLPQLYTTVFATDVEPDISAYEDSFARYFGHDHASSDPRFDLLGYDLMRVLVAYLQGKEYHGLQSDVVLEQLGEDGGWVNTGVKVIHTAE